MELCQELKFLQVNLSAGVMLTCKQSPKTFMMLIKNLKLLQNEKVVIKGIRKNRNLFDSFTFCMSVFRHNFLKINK